ncbi:hypothetical protein EKD04_017375 [Chloroflexales bacterium ZM16-3]|nr:hypothetical protein [Chloroflexales bacterium ZM16-3]
MRHLQPEIVTPFCIPERDFQIVVVGCGGNGSQIAGGLGRLCYHLRSVARAPAVNVVLIDGDRFAQKNVGRQLARVRDIGVNKAQALAARVSADYGLRFEAIPEMLTDKMLGDLISGQEDPGRGANRTNLIVVGCVDRPEARAMIHSQLAMGGRDLRWLWLDIGNHEHTGQVVLGSVRTWASLRGSMALGGICAALPSPGLLLPELVAIPKPPKKPRGRPRKVPLANCADDVATNRQSFGINGVLAAIGLEYLTQLITTRSVTRLRTTVDVKALTIASELITMERLRSLSGLSEDELRGIGPQKKG